MPTLKPHEALRLDRRNFKQGTAKAAKRWKVAEADYISMESGDLALTDRMKKALKVATPRERSPALDIVEATPTGRQIGNAGRTIFKRERSTAPVPPVRALPKMHTLHSLPTTKLKDLTVGEALVLHRRRRDESQTEAAQRYGVGRKLYALYEIDAKPFPGDAPSIPSVAAHEIAFILRRRANVSRGDLVATLGINRTWVTAMERGDMDPAPLITYWKA